MTIRQLITFVFTCDGYHPRGNLCPCNLTLSDFDQPSAEDRAKSLGWYQDHRGWICNAGGGHRGDKTPLIASRGHSADYIEIDGEIRKDER